MYNIGSKLSVPKGLLKHVGVYIGNGFVFHNSPDYGEQRVSIKRFASGRNVTVEADGVSDQRLFMQRVRYALLNPRAYSAISANCEHTVNRLREGLSSSPQLQFWAFLGFGVLAYNLAK